MHIKPEIRILGIDDSSLHTEQVMIVGAVFRGGEWMDGVLRSYITKDGTDATDTIIRMVTESKHFGQIRVLMLDGITYAGFNVVEGEIHKVVTHKGENPVYLQHCGIELEDAREIVRMSSTHSNIPEPLRAAHLIATGIVCGESTGKA
jgi:endonuclease V-like protein UPF0215 family